MSLPKFLLFCLITTSSRLRAEYAGGLQNQIVERVIVVERPLAYLFEEFRKSGAPVDGGDSDNIPPHEKYAEMARYIVHHSGSLKVFVDSWSYTLGSVFVKVYVYVLIIFFTASYLTLIMGAWLILCTSRCNILRNVLGFSDQLLNGGVK